MKRSTIAILVALAALVVIGFLIGRFSLNRGPALDPRFGTLEQQESLAVATKKAPWDLTNDPHPREPEMPHAPTSNR